MSAFFVGQRVRKARGWNVGLTGTVAEIDPFDDRGLGVVMDGPGVGFSPSDKIRLFPAGALVFGYPHEWEPILPEGWKVGEWSDCVWKPEGEVVPA